MTRSALKRKCERIARETGANLTWIEGKKNYGYYIPGTNKIFVCAGGTKHSIILIFCHELGHYKNYLSRKYYKYHHLKGKKFLRRFKTKDAVIKYALKAEIYTDKVGARLCAQYFPGVAYVGSYKNNKAYYDMMYQKYFGGYIIILFYENNPAIVRINLTNEIIYDRINLS